MMEVSSQCSGGGSGRRRKAPNSCRQKYNGGRIRKGKLTLLAGGLLQSRKLALLVQAFLLEKEECCLSEGIVGISPRLVLVFIAHELVPRRQQKEKNNGSS